MTDNPNFQKRRVRLRNAKDQHEEVGRVHSDLGNDVPIDRIRDWEVADTALQAAQDGIDGPDGERLVHVATSLVAKFQQSAAITGIKTIASRLKGARAGTLDAGGLEALIDWLCREIQDGGQQPTLTTVRRYLENNSTLHSPLETLISDCNGFTLRMAV